VLGTFLQADSSYWFMFPIFMIMGHGMGVTMAPMTAAVMNAVGHQRAGLGSAMTNTSREVGGVLGIAVLGTILTSKITSTFAPAVASLGLTPSQGSSIGALASHGDLSSATLAGLGLTSEQQAGVFQAFTNSFMEGFHVALVVGGLVLVAAAFVANRFIPGRETIAEHHAAEAEAFAIA
jgi:MFS transporter, DHA2 family, integral membrane protein